MDPKMLALQFSLGRYVFDRNLADITHEESLEPPQPGGNSLNWVVGHVVRARNQALELLEAQTLFDDKEMEMYGGASFAPARAPTLAELQDRFYKLGDAVSAALENFPAEKLDGVAPFSPTGNPNETVGSLLAGLVFHEAYHLGQTGIL